MLQISENDVNIQLCTFEAHFQKAKVNLRFPSLFFVEWKAINNKSSVSTVGRKKALNSQIDLDESLTFSTEMIHHRIQKQYLKKQSLIHLNLISNSRPDQIKLVGRVIVDLAEVANNKQFGEATTLKLMYCSVDAELTFQIKFVRGIQSNLELNQLDKSAFSDLYTFTAPKLPNRNKFELKQTYTQKRSDDERKKLVKFVQKQDTVSANKQVMPKNPKIQKILIKQQTQQHAVEYDLPRSLPLSQKKRSLKDLGQNKVIEQNRPKQGTQVQQNPTIGQVNDLISKERNLLEQQLNEHKERIKKLENDIKAALRMFEESQFKSELNKSKLIESEQAIHELIDKENQIKNQYEKLIASQKEEHARQVSMLKSGYQADIKILQATMQEQRINLVELQKTSKTLMNNYEQANLKIKEQERNIHQAQAARFELQSLKIDHESLIQMLKQKQNEVQSLLTQKANHEGEFLKTKNQLQTQLQKLSTLLKEKQELVFISESKSFNLEAELLNLRAENQQLKQLVSNQNGVFEDKIKALCEQIDTLKSSNQLKLLDSGQKSNREVQDQQNQAKISQQQEIHNLKNKIIQLQTLVQNQRRNQQAHKQQYRLELQINKQPNHTNNLQFGDDLIKIQQAKPVNMDVGQDSLKLLQQLKTQNQKIKLQLDVLRNERINQLQTLDSLRQQNIRILQSLHSAEQNIRLKQAENELLRHNNHQTQVLATQNPDQSEKNVEGNSLNRQIEQYRHLLATKEQQINKLVQQIQTIKTSKQPQQHAKPSQHQAQQTTPHHNPNIQKTPQKVETQRYEYVNESPDFHMDTNALNLNLDLLGNFNKLAEVSEEDRNRFGFEDHGYPLTSDQINKIATKPQTDRQLNSLKQQNIRLKEEIEQLRHLTAIREGQNDEHIRQKQQMAASNSDIVQKLQQERFALSQQIICLTQKIRELNDRPTLEIGDVRPVNLQHSSQYQKMQQYKRLISQHLEKHDFLQSRIYQLEGLLCKNNEKLSSIEKDESYLQELQQKIVNLQEQMKIKDELLAESQKNMEESYAVKYELADLKEKFNQLKGAMDERDVYINELEETKEYLAKQLQQRALAQSKNHDFELKLQKIQNENSPVSSHINIEINDLRSEVEIMNRQLIIYNNQNTELKNKAQEWMNQKSQIENRMESDKHRLAQNQDTIVKLTAENQRLSQQLAEKIAMEQENRGKINIQIQIGLLTAKLEEMENNLRIMTQNDNEGELIQLRQLVEVLKNEKISFVEELAQKYGELTVLNSQSQVLKQHLNQNQGLNVELASKITQLEAKAVQAIQKIQTLQNQLDNSRKSSQQVNKMLEESNQMVIDLNKQLQQANIRNEKLVQQVEQISAPNEKPQSDNVIRYDGDIEVNILKVDSYAEEAPPIVYENSVINAQDINLQLNISKEEIDNLKKEVEKLQTQLSQENKQKVIYFNELQNNKALILKLQKDIKSAKENQKINLLPLQSFDTNHLLGLRNQQVITEDERQMQPSILKQIEVHAQAQAHNDQGSHSISFKKNVEAKTQIQTYLNQQSLHALMRDLEAAKEQLQKQRKLHNQLGQVHKVCNKKYQMLSKRYQICLNQLQYVQYQCQQVVKNKKKVEQELNHCKMLILDFDQQSKMIQQKQRQAENQDVKQEKVNHAQNVEQQLRIKQVNEQPVENLTNFIQQFVPFQRDNQLQQEDYKNKIAELQKSQLQYKNKAALFEQNIQNLQKMLQQQIQLNQNHQKFSQKMQSLLEFDSKAQRWKSEMAQLRKENFELKKIKSQIELAVYQKGDLSKIIEEYQAMNPKDHMGAKLSQIGEVNSNNQSKIQMQENKQKAIEGQEGKARQQYETLSEIVMRNTQEIQSYTKSDPPRNNEVMMEIQQLRKEKLQQLQNLYTLQQKLNEVSNKKTEKQLQAEEEVNSKTHQIQELRFVNEQISRQMHQQKVTISQLQMNKQAIQVQFADLFNKYEQAKAQNLDLNIKISNYVETINHYQSELAELQNNIFTLQEEKNKNSPIESLTSEAERLRAQLDHKISQFESVLKEKSQLSEKLLAMSSQINQLKLVIQTREVENKQKEQELNKLNLMLQELKQAKKSYQQQVKEYEQSQSKILQELTVLKNRGDSKQEILGDLKHQLQEADKKISALNSKIKAKQEQSLKFSKENQQLKLINASHEQKIKILNEKQKQMKQTVALLEQQSKKIVESIKERFINEAGYYKKYMEKQRQCSTLSVAAAQFQQNIANKERELSYQRQIASQLKNEIDVLKNGAGAEEFPKILTIQYEKYDELKNAYQKVLNLNKQYLENIGKKTTAALQNQRNKQEVKHLMASLNESNALLNQTKAQYQQKKIQFTTNLQEFKQKLAIESEKVISLSKQLQGLKESKLQSENKYYNDLIAQKNTQIESLRREMTEIKMNKKQSELRETPSELDILNEQIINLSNDVLEKERQISLLQTEINELRETEILSKHKINQPLSTLKNICTTDSKHQQNYVTGTERKLPDSRLNHRDSIHNRLKNEATNDVSRSQNLVNATQQLQAVCKQIKQLCKQRIASKEQGIFEAFAKKYDQIQEQFQNINLETSQIQQKSRFISKQLQKLKAFIIKNQSRAFKQKTELLALIKPCEHAANQLITLSQTLNEGDSHAFL